MESNKTATTPAATTPLVQTNSEAKVQGSNDDQQQNIMEEKNETETPTTNATTKAIPPNSAPSVTQVNTISVPNTASTPAEDGTKQATETKPKQEETKPKQEETKVPPSGKSVETFLDSSEGKVPSSKEKSTKSYQPGALVTSEKIGKGKDTEKKETAPPSPPPTESKPKEDGQPQNGKVVLPPEMTQNATLPPVTPADIKGEVSNAVTVEGETKDIGDGIVVVTNTTLGSQTLAIDSSNSKLMNSKPYQPPQGWDSIADVVLFGSVIFIPVVVVTVSKYIHRSVARQEGFMGKLKACSGLAYSIFRNAFLNTMRLRHCRGEDLENLGSEGSLYLALHRETALLIVFLTVLSCSVLLPVHLAVGQSSVNLEFTRSTIQHLGKHSPYLWIHVLFVFLFSALYYRYVSNCRHHVEWAWKHGVIGARSMDMWDSSVFVKSKLPEKFTDADVRRVLEAVYPGQVSNVILIMDNSEATELERKRHQLESEVSTLRRFASNLSRNSYRLPRPGSKNSDFEEHLGMLSKEDTVDDEDGIDVQTSRPNNQDDSGEKDRKGSGNKRGPGTQEEEGGEGEEEGGALPRFRRKKPSSLQSSESSASYPSISRELSLLDEKEAELRRVRSLEASLRDKHAGKCIVTFASVDIATGFANLNERRKAIRAAVERRLTYGDKPMRLHMLDYERPEERNAKGVDDDILEHVTVVTNTSDGSEELEGEVSKSEQQQEEEDPDEEASEEEDLLRTSLKPLSNSSPKPAKGPETSSVEWPQKTQEKCPSPRRLLRSYSAAERAASAAVLQASIESSQIKEWDVVPSPDPHDLIWEALHLDPKIYWIRTVLANIVIALVLVAVTTPTTIISLVSHLNSNTEDVEEESPSSFDDFESIWVDMVDKVREFHPSLASFLFVFLPQLVIVLVNNALMFVVYIIAKYWEPHHTYSSQEMSILQKTFWFLLFTTLVVPAVAFKTLSAVVGDLISNDASPFTLLGQVFVVTSGAFTLTYIITQTLVGSAFQLMSLPSLIWSFSLQWLWPWATPEDRQRARDAKMIFDFGSEYATFLSILSLIIMFSTTVPVILPFGLIYFVVKICVDQYQLNYVCGRDKSHSVPRCRIGRAAVRYLPIPLLLFQIGIIGYFSSYVCLPNEIAPIAAGRNPRGCSAVSPDDPDTAVPGTQVVRGTVLQLLLLYFAFVYTASDCLYVFMVDSYNDQGMVVGAGFADHPFASEKERDTFVIPRLTRRGASVNDVLQSTRNRVLAYANFMWDFVSVNCLGKIPVEIAEPDTMSLSSDNPSFEDVEDHYDDE